MSADPLGDVRWAIGIIPLPLIRRSLIVVPTALDETPVNDVIPAVIDGPVPPDCLIED